MLVLNIAVTLAQHQCYTCVFSSHSRHQVLLNMQRCWVN